MDRNIIARITLNPGRVGWFDPITNIHLTLGAPEADITANMNTKNIQKAIKANILRVIWGNLSAPQKAVSEAQVAKAIVTDVTPAVVVQEEPQTVIETPVEKKVTEKATEDKNTSKKAARKKAKGGE